MTQVNVPRTNPPTHHNASALGDLLDDAPDHASGLIVIDLDALAGNWRALHDLVSPSRCGAVVKANAYGLGARHVIPALANAGCTEFFVATIAEAREARTLAPDATLYLLDGILPGTAEDIAKLNACPIISTLEEAREWSALAQTIANNNQLPCALMLDTGLNRLGFSKSSIDELLADAATIHRLDIKLIMSHMACADEPDHPMNEQQRTRFESLRHRLPSAPASLAASDGLMLGDTYHYDLVRPGYALYGGQAFKGATTPVAPVVTAFARVLQVHDAAKDDTVGYSASYKLDRDSRIAVLALGYADGIARTASTTNQADTCGNTTPSAAFNGRKAPFLGRISMDLITVDVTDLTDLDIKRGDWAEIIGPTISLEDAGAAAQTIGYEMLTRLGTRFHRTYVGAHAPQRPSGPAKNG